MVQETSGSRETWEFPHKGRDEAVGMVKIRRPAIELMPQWIVPRPGGEGIEASDARARREIVDALGPCVTAENRQAVGHALFGRQLERVVRRINVLRVLLNLGKQVARRNTQRSHDGVQPEGAYRPTRGDRSRIQVQRFS